MSYGNDLDVLMRARNVLFDAARSNIDDKDKLEEYLKRHAVKFRTMEPKSFFDAYTALMKEDKISQTPSCVIVDEGKKAIFTGGVDIPKALQLLK